MKRHELRDLIAAGESATVEFKRKVSSADKIARELIALANTHGGYLLVGVDDNGSIVGVDSEKSEQSLVDVAIAMIDPVPEITHEIVEIEFKDVVVVHVIEGRKKPFRFVSSDPAVAGDSGKAFIRLGERSITASRNMVRILQGDNPDAPPLKIAIGDRERRLFNFIERYGRATVSDFARLVNISRRRAAQLLVKLVRAKVIQIHHENGMDYYTIP